MRFPVAMQQPCIDVLQYLELLIRIPQPLSNFFTTSDPLNSSHNSVNLLQDTVNLYANQFDMSSNVLSDRDVNAAVDAKPDVKSMEYHRQVLQSKLEENQ